MCDVVHGEHQHGSQGRNQHYGVALKAAFAAQVACQHNPHRRHIEHDVLPEGFPVCEFDCVTKAAAVGHLVGQCIGKCGYGEEEHHGGQSPCRQAAVGVEYQQHANDEFSAYQ